MTDEPSRCCTNRCEPARCGDGIQRLDVDPLDDDFEACDDGNDDETDACLNHCGQARCGDGIQRLDIRRATRLRGLRRR